MGLFLFGNIYSSSAARLMYGIISPIVVLLTLVNNIVVVIVLYFDPKQRPPSCMQHACLAVCNTLIGLLQLPVFIHVFSSLKIGQSGIPNTHDYTNYSSIGADHEIDNFCDKSNDTSSCVWFYRVMGIILPYIFHSISIWTMVGLAIQRFLCFKFPFRAVVLYTNKTVGKLTILCIAIGVISSSIRFFDSSFGSINTRATFRDSDVVSVFNVTPNSATATIMYEDFGMKVKSPEQLMVGNRKTVVSVLSTISVHTFPCLVLVAVFILLLVAVRHNHQRRVRLAGVLSMRIAKRKTMKESSIVVLLGLFLAIEIPIATIKTRQLVSYYNPLSSLIEVILPHFMLLLTFYCYVYVYVIMNYEFRRTFLNVLRKLRPRLLRSNVNEMQEIPVHV